MTYVPFAVALTNNILFSLPVHCQKKKPNIFEHTDRSMRPNIVLVPSKWRPRSRVFYFAEIMMIWKLGDRWSQHFQNFYFQKLGKYVCLYQNSQYIINIINNHQNVIRTRVLLRLLQLSEYWIMWLFAVRFRLKVKIFMKFCQNCKNFTVFS